MQTQNILKAKALFERALDLEPENPRARECLQMAVRLMTLQHRLESEVRVA
ncbi:hypothetical protein HY213_00675 [Candidatus Peregrinibacteria bacterium]|nr:hypothetical protein [Candidatus Peregrinibacteria bacterium]